MFSELQNIILTTLVLHTRLSQLEKDLKVSQFMLEGSQNTLSVTIMLLWC